MIGLSAAESPGGENCVRTIARPKLKTTPITAAPTVTKSEPTIMDRMPKCPRLGSQSVERKNCLGAYAKDDGHAFAKDEDGDERKARDGGKGHDKQDRADHLVPLHRTLTSPSVASMVCPCGDSTKSMNFCAAGVAVPLVTNSNGRTRL
jgi:hypothetical protein